MPNLSVEVYHGSNKAARDRVLYRVQRSGGIMLTSYGLIATSWESLSSCHGRPFVWDYVILDEGHKIKNPTKTTKCLHNVPAKNRIVLTGTPIQNNLSELWSLFNFVHHGSLLGTAKTFKIEFETPIIKGRKKDASVAERKLSEEMSLILRKRIEPYFLRRTKAEALKDLTVKMSKKNDFTIWICLSTIQIELYKDFLQSGRVREILLTKKSPLLDLMILKKICDHPRLLSAAACQSLGLPGHYSGTASGGVYVDHLSDNELIEESAKLKFLVMLLVDLHDSKHRTVIFSQSVVILNIINRILLHKKFKAMRIDGSVGASERLLRIDKFEKDSSYSFFLMTTQVGGVGLTITSADRVVIYDPSWNPATDAQAVDRVYRIGQRKHVVVYRLITCGTVEEKIYKRQVFKHSLHKQTVEADINLCRYFSNQELREMFNLDDPMTSPTQIQLEKMHSASRETTVDLDKHIAFLYSLGIFGISDHNLLFSVKQAEEEQLADVEQRFIGDHINRANKLVNMECELADTARSERDKYVTPFVADFPVSAKRVDNNPADVDALSHDLNKMSPFKVPMKRIIAENRHEFGTEISHHRQPTIKELSSTAVDTMDISHEYTFKVKPRLSSDENESPATSPGHSVSVLGVCSDLPNTDKELHVSKTAATSELSVSEMAMLDVMDSSNLRSSAKSSDSDHNASILQGTPISKLNGMKSPYFKPSASCSLSCNEEISHANHHNGLSDFKHCDVEGNAEEASAVETNAEEVSNVECSMKEVSVVESNAEEVSIVESNAEEVSVVESNAEEVSVVESNAEEVSVVDSNAEEVSVVDSNAEEVSVVDSNAEEVSVVYSNAEDVSAIKSNPKEVSAVESNAQEVSVSNSNAKEVSVLQNLDIDSDCIIEEFSKVSSCRKSTVVFGETIDNSGSGVDRDSDAFIVPDSDVDTSETEDQGDDINSHVSDTPEHSPSARCQFLNSTTLHGNNAKNGDRSRTMLNELMDVSQISRASSDEDIHQNSHSSTELDNSGTLPDLAPQGFPSNKNSAIDWTFSRAPTFHPSTRESRLSASRLRRSSMFQKILNSFDEPVIEESEDSGGNLKNDVSHYFDVEEDINSSGSASSRTSNYDSGSEGNSSTYVIPSVKRRPRVLSSSEDEG